MSTYVGIDLGLRRIAAVILKDFTFTAHVLDIPSGGSRNSEVKKMVEWLGSIPIDGAHVVYESAIMGGSRNVQTAVGLAQTSGIVHASLVGRASDIQQVAVSSWKKITVGRGNVTKPEVRQWLDENHPVLAELCGRNQDLYDAACIALYGRAVDEGVQH